MTIDDKLREIADGALTRARRNREKALRSFVATLMSDAKLVTALARPYVWQRADEMHGSRIGESLDEGGSHSIADLPDPPSSSRPSHPPDDGLSLVDRPAAPSTRDGAASPNCVDSHERADRRAAPATSFSKTATAAFARRSIFDTTVTTATEFVWGDITPREFRNLQIRNAFTRELEIRLEPVIRRAPHQTARLREYATEAEIEAIAEACTEKETAAREAVKQVTYATR